jgi:hypothetical protein
MSFQQAKKSGRVAEQIVGEILRKAGVVCRRHEGKNSEWDLQCVLSTGIVFTIEVKYDLLASTTGNIAIEYANPRTNKPSGLFATKSNLWFIVLDKPLSVWVAKTEDLKLFFSTQPPLKIIEKAGDGNAALRLYSKDHILDSVFSRLDELPPWSIFKELENLLGCNPLE